MIFRRKKSYQERTARLAYIFVAPWLIGFLLFFLKPLIELFYYSFNKVEMNIGGGLTFTPVGIAQYKEAFLENTKFNPLLSEAILSSMPRLLLVLIFSLIVAVLLNGKFVGRGLARAIFFIPIIMASKTITSVVGGMQAQMITEVSGQDQGNIAFLTEFLARFLDPQTLDFLLNSVSTIFNTVLLSGVQSLIFLSGLQSISNSHYEVAKIEGASNYETFWRVTIPMISPMILIAAVYTLSEHFMTAKLVDYMNDIAFKTSNYGLSAAMSVVYLIVSLLIVSLVSFIISRRVYYND